MKLSGTHPTPPYLEPPDGSKNGARLLAIAKRFLFGATGKVTPGYFLGMWVVSRTKINSKAF